MITKEKSGALVMLVFALAYGYQATKMPLTFLAAQEIFNSKTLPLGLAVAAVVVSLLILVLPVRGDADHSSFLDAFKGKVWNKTIWLFVDMGLYGFVMPYFGFIIASILFLFIGFYILGERRWLLMILASVVVVIALWGLLSLIMGVYIAPGEIFYLMGVIE